jgi:hypothetical protein
MKPAHRGMSSKNLLFAAAGGGALILVAAQLVAKPEQSARTTTRPATANRSVERMGQAPPPLQLAGTPPVRELFRPLVSEKPPAKPAAPTAPPPAPAPSLPPVTTQPPPAPAPEPVSPPEPTGPSTSEVRMLGVVELGGEIKALLKRTTTGETRYFARGEEAFGFTVGEITDTSVELAHNGQSRRVEMSREVTVEGPGAASSTGTSSLSMGSSSRSGSFRGRERSDRDRGDRDFRRDRGDRGGSESGRSDDALSTSQIMSLPTWTERLKKLEELKSKLEPSKYERLKKFMESRAQAEQQSK